MVIWKVVPMDEIPSFDKSFAVKFVLIVPPEVTLVMTPSAAVTSATDETDPDPVIVVDASS